MKQLCKDCQAKLDCVSAFGIYWGDKSHGGVGCEYPLRCRRKDAPARHVGLAASGKAHCARGAKWR